jgi:L-fuconolactonase
MRIDSHHHFWQYNATEYGWISEQMEVLRQDFLPNQLQATVAASGVDAVVSVQARQTTTETEWLLSLADAHPFVLGVVGWVPLAEPSIDEALERFSNRRKLVAVRHVVHDEPDDAFILGTDFNTGIRKLLPTGLAYDLLIFGKHLANTIEFVDQHPDQVFVLDHIAKPIIQAGEIDRQWQTEILQLGKRQNVWCKFSGVATEVRDEEWSVDLIQPYWETVIEAFGSDRLMFGSDWPVCLLRTSYDRWTKAVQDLSSKLSPTEQNKFWELNARQAYGLPND